MRILEMTATFGGLDHAKLCPGPGFTLVSAPNESGKSTWAAFLRAMLYGFPARDRDKVGYIAEKNRYQPWSGAPMEGTLTLEWQGRELTLYRGPKGATAWGAFSAVWTATKEPVPGLTAENCGETLTGVTREVFERTAFFPQGSGALSPSAELEKRIAALWTTGDEEVSYSQVERRLLDWRNRRKVNVRVGRIPELEGELAQVNAALESQGTILERSLAAQREREELEEQRTALHTQIQAHAAYRAAQQSQRRQEAQTQLTQAQDKAQAAGAAMEHLPDDEALHQAQGELKYLNDLTNRQTQAENAIPPAREKAEAAQREADSDPYFKGMDPAQAAAQAGSDRDLSHKLLRKFDLRRFALVSAVIFAFWALVLSFLLWGESRDVLLHVAPIAAAALAGGIGLGAVLLFFGLHLNQKKGQTILAKYHAQTPQDITARATTYAQKVTAAQEAQRACEEARAELDRLTVEKLALTDKLLTFVRPFAPEVTNPFGLSAALSKALQQRAWYREAQTQAQAARQVLEAIPGAQEVPEGPVPAQPPEGDPADLSARLALVERDLTQVRDESARLRGELNSLGDPAELTARREALTEELERRQGEVEAINAALESLKNADDLLRERFSPAINARAGEYLSALTGGRYATAALTRQFQALAGAPDAGIQRQDLLLSGGAAQQLYLALRLAMCDLALPQEEPCPILLDDTLDSFDDGRAALALECLLETSKNRQVLLFTCHSREKALLAGKPATVVEL